MTAYVTPGYWVAGYAEGDALPVTNLHGRRVRGKRVYFPDEIDPVQEPEVIREVIRKVEAPTLPGLEPLAAQLAEAKREAAALLARIARERKAKDRQDKIAALSTELAMVAEAIEETKAQERAWIARLRDEDEFFLLAA